MGILSKLFSENTKSNPLYPRNLTGLDASIANAALDDETRLMKARKEARKKQFEDFKNSLGKGDYA